MKIQLYYPRRRETAMAFSSGYSILSIHSSEYFYFGRCAYHAQGAFSSLVNLDLVVEVTYEEYMVAEIMQT